FVDLAGEVLRHQALEGVGDVGQVAVGGGVRVDLETHQAVAETVSEPGAAVPDPLPPQVPEVVGGVGGDHQGAAALAGGGERERGGDGGLADPALPAQEQHATLGGQSQQHR